MDNHQGWGGVNYSESALSQLGSLAARLATALVRYDANPDGAWHPACVDLILDIEQTRNPSRYVFGDTRRLTAGTKGFDRLAAIEEVYSAHDELLSVNGWQILAESQHDADIDQLCSRIVSTPEIVERLRIAAETIEQFQSPGSDDTWSEPLSKAAVARQLKIATKTIDRWRHDSNTPYEFRDCGKSWLQYRVRSR